MKLTDIFDKRSMHFYAVIVFVVLSFIIVGLLMLKYHVEGEKNLPFNIKQISIVSTAKGVHDKGEGETWEAIISQQNDVYVQIEKNGGYKKEETIERIAFENFIITRSSDLGEIGIYKPSGKDNLYDYSEKTKIENSVEYFGAQFTDTGILEINNQGRTNWI